MNGALDNRINNAPLIENHPPDVRLSELNLHNLDILLRRIGRNMSWCEIIRAATCGAPTFLLLSASSNVIQGTTHMIEIPTAIVGLMILSFASLMVEGVVNYVIINSQYTGGRLHLMVHDHRSFRMTIFMSIGLLIPTVVLFILACDDTSIVDSTTEDLLLSILDVFSMYIATCLILRDNYITYLNVSYYLTPNRMPVIGGEAHAAAAAAVRNNAHNDDHFDPHTRESFGDVNTRATEEEIHSIREYIDNRFAS